MVYEFRLPDLGEGITEGEIVKWRVKEGDEVEEHQVVVEIETDKAIVEVPSPKKGRVVRLERAEGEIVDVGDSLLTLEVGGEEAGKEERPGSVSVVGRLPEAEEVLATPKVRNLAKRLGVNLAEVKATGPGGRVTEEDVRAAAGEGRQETSDRYGPVERVQIKGVRKSIAKNLLAAQRTAASVTGMDEADITELWELKKREEETARKRGIRLTLLPFFIKAAQHALREHPFLNASVDEDTGEIIVKKYYNIGVAVDTPDGLMVPVVKGVDGKSILDIAAEVQELGRKARERRITLDELKGSTFTISNFGTFGGTYATPIINHPDVAILGTGRVRERPWIKDGEIAVRKILPLSFTFDHRVVDGAQAAAFLNNVIEYLEDPGLLFIESS